MINQTEKLMPMEPANNIKNKPPAYRRITLRYKMEEWAVIEADIVASGLSINEFYRQLSLNAPPPRKARRPRGIKAMQLESQLLGQLGKLGSNLNQLAKQANRAGRSAQWEAMPRAKEIETLCWEVAVQVSHLQDALRGQSGQSSPVAASSTSLASKPEDCTTEPLSA